MNSGVVESSEFLELCRLFTSVTAEPQMNLYRCDMFIYLVLTALPWSAQKLHEECPGVLRELLQIIEAYMDQRKQLQEYESVLASVELCSPFDNEGVFIGEVSNN